MDRRTVLKCLGATTLGGALPLAHSAEHNVSARNDTIDFAGYDYDRVRGIMDGRVELEGGRAKYHVESIYGVTVSAFGPKKKYDVTEIGLIPYLRKYVNEGFRAYTLIPVFLSRVFRHRNIFVHVDSGIEKPEDLKGKRVGTPGYAFSANTWIRGFLKDEHGVEPHDMHWIETTESSDGGKVSPSLNRHYLPDSFPLEKGAPGVDESELLVSGGCDALITAITPKAFLDGHPKIRRLFTDPKTAEQNYYRKTALFPIMHVAAVRTDMIDDKPWLPAAAFRLYNEARKMAYADLASTTALKVTLPWVTQEFEDTQKLMGKDFWPYGIESNRKELELAVRYAHEQGLIKHRPAVEELFHPSTLKLTEKWGYSLDLLPAI